MSRTRLLVALLPLLVLTACSGGKDDAPTPEPVTEAPAEPTPEPVPVTTLAVSLAKVTFVVIKNGEIEVPGNFETTGGSVTLTGGDLSSLRGQLSVELSGVNTDEDTRDKNLRETLFGLAEGATGQATVEIVAVDAQKPVIEVGGGSEANLSLEVTILGTTSDVTVPVMIERHEDHWTVETPESFGVSMTALGMSEQAAALMALCNEELGDTVSVRANFELK